MKEILLKAEGLVIETEVDGVWRFEEGVEASYLVLATDVEDEPNELRWSVVGELPEGAEFIDNEDSTQYHHLSHTG